MADPKRLLMIAYHFPPLAGSSGIQRTLRFVQHLPASGWQALVLSTHPRAYERTSDDLLAEVPAGTVVKRAQAWDTARHFAIAGRYPGALARPDRWISWRTDAVRTGMEMIRTHRPAAIWSTYPIATAHVIGAELARRSGLPWIADFRDPMAQDGYPEDPRTHAHFERVERAAIEGARYSVVTTPGTARLYRERYPAMADRIVLLENGYDEESFVRAEAAPGLGEPLQPGCFTLLHSGIVYPSERDPTQLMQALHLLAQRDGIAPGRLKVRFRAPAHDELVNRLAKEHGVEAFVETLPPVPYAAALTEMMRADALLVLQASNCNDQIPAKLYEYLRTGRKLIALTDPAGDTADAIRRSGVAAVAPLDDAQAIADLLRYAMTRDGAALLPDASRVGGYSRHQRSAELAALLARASGRGAAA